MLLGWVAPNNRVLFCWQSFSDLGPVLPDYLHCLCQCRQFGWHRIVLFVGIGLHLPYNDSLCNHIPHFSVSATTEYVKRTVSCALTDGAVCIGGTAVSEDIWSIGY